MDLTVDWLWQQVLAFAALIWGYWEVKFILGHIALNTVAAVAAGIYTKTFLLGKLGEFLYRKVLPLLLLFGAFAAFGEATKMQAMTGIAFAGIEAMLAADLLDNVKKVGLHLSGGARGADAGGGFKIPDWLTK